MLGWHSLSSYDTATTIAGWTALAASLAAVVLFLNTLVLRGVTNLSMRRRERLVKRWRRIFATATLSETEAKEAPLPSISSDQAISLLQEWNFACDLVRGSSAECLVLLADRLGLRSIAQGLLQSHRLAVKLVAIQALGYMRDVDTWRAISTFLINPNTALSVTAAVALTSIDPAKAVNAVIPMISIRRDWPRTRVSRFLQIAGSDLVSEPLYRTIRSSEDDDKMYLLHFVQLADSEARDALALELLRESKNPRILAAALKTISGCAGVPRIEALAMHEDWIVRVQAANVLGRMGERDHLDLLENLLDDEQWWVRYRAAQSVVSLPFMSTGALRRLRSRQSDKFARDILDQAMAEVGLP